MRTPLQRVKSIFAAYPFVTVLCTWLLIVVVAYGFMALHHVYQVERARKLGLEAVQDVARRAGLPLLEKNTDALHAALAEVALKPGVLLAWVADHQNRMVAIVGSDQIIPAAAAADPKSQEVDVRQLDVPLPAVHFNLVAPVSYAGTRIGRVGLSIAPDARSDPKEHFTRVVVLSGFFVLALMAALYHRQLARLFQGWSGGEAGDGAPALDLARAQVTCPLCGRNHPFARDLFAIPDPDELCLVTVPDQPGGTRPVCIGLGETAGRQDLAWLRQRVVARCADIIRRLSA
jgi:hypothetical protein